MSQINSKPDAGYYTARRGNNTAPKIAEIKSAPAGAGAL
jgi:hypothetical protein